jgi:hypothetical protein
LSFVPSCSTTLISLVWVDRGDVLSCDVTNKINSAAEKISLFILGRELMEGIWAEHILLCDGFADAKYSIVSYSVSEKT